MARILVVDDDDEIRSLLRAVLTRHGYEVTEAANGLIAIRLLKREAFDIVITDLVMPDKEGLETIQEIVRDFPYTPVIAISGWAREGPHSYLRVAEQFGASYTFTKPLDFGGMLAAIKTLLGEEVG